MSGTVKSLKVTYNPVNDSNTFANGDCVSGKITLEVAKDCEIQSLYIKFKGKAEVLWTERHGQTTVTYHSKDKYFSMKHFFVRDKYERNDDQQLLADQSGETFSSVIPPGIHIYPFTFHFPHQDMPSTFTGSVGKVVYLLEGRLSRSMRISTKDTTKLTFVSRTNMNPAPELMALAPQHETKDKKLKLFNSGTVALDVDLEKTGFTQGEGLKVFANIQNNSSREIKPKYCVYRKHSFFARGKRRVHTKDLIKEVGEPIPPSAHEKLTRVIKIPPDMEPSIYNCTILKSEYRLRVYLDVKYASDPEIKFPIIILPTVQMFAAAPPPAAAAGIGYGAFGEPPAWSAYPQPQPPAAPNPLEPPPPYGAYGMYPPLEQYGNK